MMKHTMRPRTLLLSLFMVAILGGFALANTAIAHDGDGAQTECEDHAGGGHPPEGHDDDGHDHADHKGGEPHDEFDCEVDDHADHPNHDNTPHDNHPPH